MIRVMYSEMRTVEGFWGCSNRRGNLEIPSPLPLIVPTPGACNSGWRTYVDIDLKDYWGNTDGLRGHRNRSLGPPWEERWQRRVVIHFPGISGHEDGLFYTGPEPRSEHPSTKSSMEVTGPPFPNLGSLRHCPCSLNYLKTLLFCRRIRKKP